MAYGSFVPQAAVVARPKVDDSLNGGRLLFAFGL